MKGWFNMYSKKLLALYAFFLLLQMIPCFGQAQDDKTQDDKTKENIKIEDSYNQWKGLGFGMAFAFIAPFQKIVDGYSIEDNRVVVTDEKKYLGQILLESHFFFPLRRPIEGKYSRKLLILHQAYLDNIKDPEKKKSFYDALNELEEMTALRTVGIGPFVCILPGTDQILKAIGFGGMIGFRRGKTSNSFNIGFGYINYSDVNIFIDPDIEGEQISASAKEFTKKSNAHGLMLLFSFSF
jgi:hypothetical protein